MTFGPMECSVSLGTTDILLRYKSEWDPRAHAHTKGGYLEGEITLPQVGPGEELCMTLETFPAEDTVRAMEAAGMRTVHPAMLHNVRMGHGRRNNNLEPVPTKIHWRQQFQIQNNQVFIINRTSELDKNEDGSWRRIPEKDEVTKVNGNKILLGGNKDNLNLVFLKPKQSKCDATIVNILGDRLETNDEAELKRYSKFFTGKESGINLMKIRLKVTFYRSSGETLCSAITPQTVVDNGNKKIGSMDMYDAWPRRSSTEGGRKVIMVSEYTLANDVMPRFQIFDQQGVHRTDMEHFLAQPSSSPSEKIIKNGTIIFLTPPQTQLPKIVDMVGAFEIRLVAWRESDGLVSEHFFTFQYDDACDQSMDGKDMPRIETLDRAKPRHKKRTMHNEKKLDSPCMSPEYTYEAKRPRSECSSSAGTSPATSPPHHSEGTVTISGADLNLDPRGGLFPVQGKIAALFL